MKVKTLKEKCSQPQLGKLIDQYQFGLLSEDQTKAFENHLLDCDKCMQEYFDFNAITDILKENKSEFLAVLNKPSKAGFWNNLMNRASQLLSQSRISLASPGYITAVAMAVVLLLVGWLAILGPQQQHPVAAGLSDSLDTEHVLSPGIDTPEHAQGNISAIKNRMVTVSEAGDSVVLQWSAAAREATYHIWEHATTGIRRLTPATGIDSARWAVPKAALENNTTYELSVISLSETGDTVAVFQKRLK